MCKVFGPKGPGFGSAFASSGVDSFHLLARLFDPIRIRSAMQGRTDDLLRLMRERVFEDYIQRFNDMKVEIMDIGCGGMQRLRARIAVPKFYLHGGRNLGAYCGLYKRPRLLWFWKKRDAWASGD
ncbi:hypothetical protein FNV43_RR06083 [Rhamnella rubrinervis]|uniref:Uncharacterized protein n=1 Tax=Rhamnella rubrinervis TaxID=2594499 RepID=A0A8K0ML28_9ROSA|nr:hypothetical protein FNV43_RR06083 [Rhamnella rubrinervis]